MEMEQEEKIDNLKLDEPAILIVSHPYTIYDSFLGKPVVDFLHKEGVKIIYADIADKNQIKNLSENISSDLYWTYNKELLGGLELYKDKVVDYVLTEDSDVLLYDIPVFLMKFDEKKMTVVTYSLNLILKFYSLSFEEFFNLCILLGTDYNPTLCSLKNSLEVIKNKSFDCYLTRINIGRLKQIFDCQNLTFEKIEFS
jgi:predicted nucleotide-binding protein (sugar kinase/HSP70/actin superfamily)